MSIRDLVAFDEDDELIIVKSQTIFVPVHFKLPDDVKETIPLMQLKYIVGNKVCRFYNLPQRGDWIDWKGHRWEVTGYHHQPLKKGSPGRDKLPNILTEYIGELEVTEAP